MKRTSIFIVLISLCFFHFGVFASERETYKKLAVKYAELVGMIELSNVAFSEVNKRCNTQFHNSDTFLFEVDYYLRQNIGYSFNEFVSFMDTKKETASIAKQLIDELLERHGGCNTSLLEQWYSSLANNSKEEQLTFLKKKERLLGLPKIDRTDNHIKNQFNLKLKSYKKLPYAEVVDLASALEHGSYRYSLRGASFSIKVDKQASLNLWQFVAQEFNDPSAYYAIGKLLQTTAKNDALIAFEQSAKLGYRFAEIWLGTYYACNHNIVKAKYWLDIAKKNDKDSEYIDDIYSEIDELGMPTNCVDGWVY